MPFLLFPNSAQYADWGFLLLENHLGSRVFFQRNRPPKSTTETSRKSGPERWIHCLPRLCRSARLARHFVRSADAMGSTGADSDHVWRHLHEGGEVEDRFLGREVFRLAL